MSAAAPLQAKAARPASGSSHAGLLLQRKCACGSPASALTSECAPCQSKGRLQAKLVVGASNDPLEHEADRLAEQVLQMPQPKPADVPGASKGGGLRVSRYFSAASVQGTPEVPPAVRDVMRSPGQALDPTTRSFMEARFAHDFGAIRVHTDGAAATSSQELGARAYTVGRHIAFGAGQFVLGTTLGRRLLAHELAHTIQQGESGANAPAVQRAMKFELQTANSVHRAKGSQRAPLIPANSKARKFGPTSVPKHSQWLHKGVEGTPATDSKEGSVFSTLATE